MRATRPESEVMRWNALADFVLQARGLGIAFVLVGVLATASLSLLRFDFSPQTLFDTTSERAKVYFEHRERYGADDHILLFLIEAPVMVIAAVLASCFVIEIPEQEEPGRKPFAEVQDLFLGVLLSIGAMVCVLREHSLVAYALMGFSTLLFAYHFRDLLSSRLLRLAIIVTVLVYIGNIIPSNMALFSKDVLGVDPDQTAGYQNAMRFGFKAIAGLMLGWILTRSNARSGVLVTSGLYVMALVWAIFASSGMYLFAFGIFGAGELVGVYAPNYILSASRKSQMRRSMVLMNLLMAPVGQLGPVFGKIADSIREKGITAFGESSEAFGFKVSFAVCALVIVLGILVAVVWLPGNPSPADDGEADVS